MSALSQILYVVHTKSVHRKARYENTDIRWEVHPLDMTIRASFISNMLEASKPLIKRKLIHGSYYLELTDTGLEVLMDMASKSSWRPLS